jgi:hypothetical protein
LNSRELDLMSEILATHPALPGEAPTVEGRLADMLEAPAAELRLDGYRLSASDTARVVAALRIAANKDTSDALGRMWLAGYRSGRADSSTAHSIGEKP